jgi:hypothetical protein
MPRKKANTEISQLNFSAMPTKTRERFKEFEHNYKKAYSQPGLSSSQVGKMVLEVGLDNCEPEVEKKLKQHDK